MPARRPSAAAFTLPTALAAAGLAAVAAVALAPRQEGAAAPPPAVATPATDALTWTDLSGNTYGPADLAKAKATVFLFSSTQCPISNKYTGRFAALQKEYAPKGVRFFLVNSNAADSADSVKKYVREWKLAAIPAVKDRGTELADRLKASATPEAVIVDPAGVTRYLGRIDDSQDPAKVTKRDAAAALDALLAGKPVPAPRTRAVGCAIFRDAPAVASAATKDAPTYARDIAPILNKNCVTCHRPGDVAPFALDSYAMAKTWAPAIKEYTARRIMPPWKAVPGHGGPFRDERWLSDAELKNIAAWADAGAPMGDKAALPAPPKLPAPGAWALGQPDMVLKPVKPFHLEAEGKDVYRNFTLPADFEKDTFVKAMDFKPQNRGIVHHIIAYIDRTGKTAAAMDNKETEPGWSVSGGGSGIEDDDWGSGWAPGVEPMLLPPGVAVRIPRGAKLVLQVHYHKTGKPEVDQSTVGLYLAKEPVTDVLRTAPVGNPMFKLKPGIADNLVKAGMVVPFPVTVYGVLPHMHLLGKEMQVVATLPDGTKKPLILVKDWDFNWQLNYKYVEPVKLPAGTRIDVRALYDNTASNPNQPNNPPQEVGFGEQTTDEMCFAFVEFTRDRSASAAPAAAAKPAEGGR